MATNLRLSDELTAQLRAEAERSGRSQQEVIRRALEALFAGGAPTLTLRPGARAPKRQYRAPRRRLRLGAGATTRELLDREDRL